jgi:alpha-amylase
VLTGVKAEDGDQVFVCGGFPELGEWNADKARKMDRKGDEWTTTIKVASGAEIAFKFLRRTADGKTVWEDGENRTAPAKARVESTWR